MKFVKILKAEDNTYKYCANKLKQHLDDIKTMIKTKEHDINNRHLNYDNTELVEELESLNTDKNNIENYLKQKNDLIEQSTNNIKNIALAILEAMKIQTSKGVSSLGTANIEFGLEDLETKEDITNQIIDALKKNIK